jgi:hypothetical protein
MPRRSKAIGPETAVAEATPATPTELKGTKTAAVKRALAARPDLQPKEIAAMLRAEGWDIKAQLVSVIKSNLKSKEEEPKKAAATPRTTKPATAVKTTDISLDSLKKAKQLAAQLGGIEQAKEALAALSELLD